MKRILLSCLCLILLTGCNATDTPTPSNKLNVVTTIFPQYDFARQIAGEYADVTMLLPLGSESHSFEPTPKDILKLQHCDLFIYVGGSSDAWVERILSSMDTGNMRILTLMDLVDIAEEEHIDGATHQENGDENHTPEYDEHVWTSPKNAKIIVQKIAEALCEVDSKNTASYQINTANYLEKLDILDSAFREVVNNGKRKTVLFGGRFPFQYFTDAYGLKAYAAFPGCATEDSASAATVSFLIDTVKAGNLPVVLHLEFSNKKLETVISEETGAKILLFHSCHTVSKADFKKGVGYLELMTGNVESLKEALN